MKAGLGTAIGRAVLAAALLAATVSAGARAQTKPAEPDAGQQFDDWRRSCDPTPGGGPDTCVIRQLVVNKENDKAMLIVAMGYFGDKHQPGAIFEVPLGLFLPAGVVFSIPGVQPIRVVVQTCLPQGCRAALLLPADALAALKKGDEAQVTVETAQRKKVSAPISLKGFSKAFASLK
jgi:invasion protein IalB